MKTGPKNMDVKTLSQRKGADVTLPMQTIQQWLVLDFGEGNRRERGKESQIN